MTRHSPPLSPALPGNQGGDMNSREQPREIKNDDTQ